MKKTLYIISAVLIASMMFTSCHSSEKNYREAYENAKIEAERQRYTHVINGDSVRMVYVNATVAIDSTDQASDYNVVVATFSQRINAKSYRDRLREECGYKGSYVLFGGKDKQYYVVLQGFDNSGDAAALLRGIDQKVCLKILEPLPWILKKI